MNQQEILARNLLDHAKQFRDASIRLSNNEPFIFHPTFYCVIHSLELAIKAHLAFVGISKKKLSSKGLGHNLAALIKEVEVRNMQDSLQLNDLDRLNISQGSKNYAGKCFEYPEDPGITFSCDIWHDWTNKVINGFPKYKS